MWAADEKTLKSAGVDRMIDDDVRCAKLKIRLLLIFSLMPARHALWGNRKATVQPCSCADI